MWNNSFSIDIYWFQLKYNGSTKLEWVPLKTDDLDEIIGLYQEVWDNLKFKDSLLIAERYAQWLWANAFAQGNLDTLKEQGLVISNIKKTQIWIEKDWEKVNAVLIEYEITEWLINDIPLLYVCQLFLPKDNNDMILISFITENKSSHLNAVNMFKNIK